MHTTTQHVTRSNGPDVSSKITILAGAPSCGPIGFHFGDDDIHVDTGRISGVSPSTGGHGLSIGFDPDDDAAAILTS